MQTYQKAKCYDKQGQLTRSGISQIKLEIESRLSESASDYWHNTQEQGDFIAIAQRNGIEAAVAEIESMVEAE